MPHLILEYSANIIEKKNLTTLLKKCHKTLAEMLPTDVTSCVSRAIECNTFCVGEGFEKNAFIHVSLKVKAGRTEETLQNAGNEVLEVLSDYFAETAKRFHLQITMEIGELSPFYFKLVGEGAK